MSGLILPALFAVLLWWFSTGVVLYLDGISPRAFGAAMMAAVGVALAGVYGLIASSTDTSVAGAYIAFSSALVVWGVLELSYYLGFITGVHSEACPAGCSQWRRFALALGASIYHELAVLFAAGVVLLATRDGANQFGLWTFMVLWLMRWSAKLNLFLGVSNFHQEWLPAHLRYIVSYIARRPMNLLFPISVSAATALAAVLMDAALSPSASSFEQAGLALVAALLALAVLEHWFLVLPLADGELWRWALRRETAPRRVDVHHAASDVIDRAAPPGQTASVPQRAARELVAREPCKATQ